MVGNRKNTGCDQEAVGREIGPPGFTDEVTARTGFAIRRSSDIIAGIGKLPFFSRYLRFARATPARTMRQAPPASGEGHER
jgi:hypothetical protein